MENLLSQPWFGALIGIGGIVISIIISCYFYFRSQIGPRPSMQVKSIKIISKDSDYNLKDVDITFKGQKLDVLNKIYIFFWNNGKKTINGSDIVKSDMLKLTFIAGEILAVNIIKRTREVNKVSFKVSDDFSNEGIINFDFLDPGDGFVLEILHTSNSLYPILSGVIKGIPRGIKDYGIVFDSIGKPNGKRGKFSSFIYKLRPINTVIMFAIGMSFLLLGIYFERLPQEIFEVKPDRDRWFFIAFGVVFLLSFISSITIAKRRFPKSLMIID